MFNPKITPGPWEIWPMFNGDNVCTDLGPIAVGGTGDVFAKRADDLKATAAVPELLEVYNAAKVLINKFVNGNTQWNQFGMEASDLATTIQKLEERHCERN